MKPQLYPLLKNRIKKDKGIEMRDELWINIKALYNDWRETRP